MVNKVAIFVVGDHHTGKSTLIRSLTGAARNQIYNVKNGNGQLVHIFVSFSSPQEMSMTKHPPANFPDSIEQKYGVNRSDYDAFISAMRLEVRDQRNYGYEQYINSVRSKGFDVKIAIIENSWNNIPTNAAKLSAIASFTQRIGCPFIKLNAFNDPNAESSTLKRFYP
jgi:GTPase SAR1 family protein